MGVLHHKTRCAQCGAKNDDVQLCRICGLVLPMRIDPKALNFEALIDQELASWRVIAEHPVMGE
jgi:hypothetical protein